MEVESKHLWEVEHPYYCSGTNYYVSSDRADETVFTYKSWPEFLTEMADADLDMNLLFRWDWQEGEKHGVKPFNGDIYYRNGRLKLFYMAQRKGFHTCAMVDVCRADEPSVIGYLKPRLTHLLSLWAPLIPQQFGTE
jgi:hypothetical protein